MNIRDLSLVTVVSSLMLAGCASPYNLSAEAAATRASLSPERAMAIFSKAAQEKEGVRGFCGLQADYGITPELNRINNAVISYQIDDRKPGKVNFIGTEHKINWSAPATRVSLATVNVSTVQRSGTLDLSRIESIDIIDSSEWHKWWCSPDKRAEQGYLVRLFDDGPRPNEEVFYFNIPATEVDGFLAAVTYFSPKAKLIVPTPY